jgi:L-rhamnose isomerase
MLEELKGMPFGVVWDFYCAKMGVPAGRDWMVEIKGYEDRVFGAR